MILEKLRWALKRSWIKNKMPKRRPNKYNRKFIRQLERGLRKDGKSIVEICQLWGISENTYYEWIREHGEFAYAHEIGKRDEKAYWQKLCRRAAEGEIKANGTILKVAASVMLGWQEKVTMEHTTQPIQTIKIELIDSHHKSRVIEHNPIKELEYEESDGNHDISDEKPD